MNGAQSAHCIHSNRRASKRQRALRILAAVLPVTLADCSNGCAGAHDRDVTQDQLNPHNFCWSYMMRIGKFWHAVRPLHLAFGPGDLVLMPVFNLAGVVSRSCRFGRFGSLLPLALLRTPRQQTQVMWGRSSRRSVLTWINYG